MTSSDPRFVVAIAAIDRANADDPEMVDLGDGPRPKELVHAERMTAWVERLAPDASDVQLLAARSHHLRRWEVPRSSHPEGRAGYLRWRTAQKKRHAELVGELLVAAGYGDDDVAAVQRIVRKEGLGTDPAVQVHEDALCLVFLELQYVAYAAEWGPDKTAEIVRKTAAKMSPAGLALVGDVGLPPAALDDIGAALAG